MKKIYKKIVWALIVTFVFTFCSPIYALEAWRLSEVNIPAGPSVGTTGVSTINAASNYSGNAIVEDEYQLAPGDQVAVNLIVGDNDMSISQVFSIGPDGKIYFPNIGEIDLLGLTIPKAKELIDKKIKESYKEKYSFSFRLSQPRRIQIYLTGSEDKPLYIGEQKFVSVYGEVARAGRFEFLPGKKFTDYISYAGGPTARANLSFASITRRNQKITINGSDVIFGGNSSADLEIMPGDVINVPTQFFYFNDFASFTSLLFTMLAFYTTFIKR